MSSGASPIGVGFGQGRSANEFPAYFPGPSAVILPQQAQPFIVVPGQGTVVYNPDEVILGITCNRGQGQPCTLSFYQI